MKVNIECFKKSVKHDYKNLIEIVIATGIVCAVWYAGNYILTTYGDKIAAAENSALGFVGGLGTAYNLLCFFLAVITIGALSLAASDSKSNDITYKASGGLYVDIGLGLCAQVIVAGAYTFVSWLNMVEERCTSYYISSCSAVSNGVPAYPSMWAPLLISITILAVLSPLAVSYARCKEQP